MNDVACFADLHRFDLARVHGWLSRTYWSDGIPRELVERGFRASTAVCGAFAGDEQVGCARVLSDTVRFGYIADVYVDAAWRHRGIARTMVRFLIGLPLLAQVQSWYLLTKDAQAVYAGLGFAVFDHPERFMVLRRPRSW